MKLSLRLAQAQYCIDYVVPIQPLAAIPNKSFVICHLSKLLLAALMLAQHNFMRSTSTTWSHPYKLYKQHSTCAARSFFTERVVNIWNSLPVDTDFSSLPAKHERFLRATACYSAHMLSPVLPSVTRVDQSKTLEVRIMQLSPPGSPIALVSPRLTSSRNSKGDIGSEGAK